MSKFIGKEALLITLGMLAGEIGCQAAAPTVDPRTIAASQTLAASADLQTQAIQAQATEVFNQGRIVAQSATDIATRFVVTETPKPTAIVTATMRVEARPATATAVKPAVVAVTAPMQEIFKAKDALAYPALMVPDPSREPVFPDVAKGDRKPLAAYEQPFANADFFHTGKGELSLPQYYYRLVTGRHIAIPQLGVDVSSNGRKGALVLLVNHFGETATYPGSTAENSFTVAGRIFDMGTPEKMTQAAQALLDHNVGRMINSADGANCSVIDACNQVEWHVVVVGGGKAQDHWAGLYTK